MVASMRTLWRLCATVLIGGLGVGLAVAAMIPGAATLVTGNEYTGDLSDALAPLDERSFVYAANGTVIGKLGRQDREPAKLSEVPQVLIDAIITIEDESFYTNPGVDLEATIRALAANLDSGAVVQGGSTITQQLVKNRIVGEAVDADRKIREAILALRITANYSKNEVLEQYLNTVYFGQNSWGVKAAAERMFITEDPETGAKTAKELLQLNLADAALLAGVINNPEGNNPFTNPEGALIRRTLVLERMLATDKITEEEFGAAALAPLPSVRPDDELRPETDYVQTVQNLIRDDDDDKFGLGESSSDREGRLLGGGLRIYTALEPVTQLQAEAALANVVPDDRGGATAALVAMDPRNGHVVAMANLDPFSDQREVNVITRSASTRQQGSTFKAITLAAAFENGYSPDDTIDGSNRCADIPDYTNEDPPYGVNAGDGAGRGVQTLRLQAQGSVNCAFLRLQQAVGDQTVADVAIALGLPKSATVEPNSDDRVPDSLTLGTLGARPLDMATVFATLAADGIRHDPVFITRIEKRDGTVIFQDQSDGRRVVSAETARTVTDVLRGVIDGGTGTNAKLEPARDGGQFGKTGTTDLSTDAWFAGSVPQLTAVVWMGHLEGNDPLGSIGQFSTVYGGTFPALIWKDFMQAALADESTELFVAPNPALWPDSRRVTVAGRGTLINPPPPPPTRSPPSTSTSTTTTLPPATTLPPTTTTTVPPPTTTTVPPGP